MVSLPPYTTRYLRQSGVIAWDAVALESCRVDEQFARNLHVAALLEEDTAISARQARALGLDRAPDIGAFLDQWEREEAEHGRAIRAMLTHQSHRPSALWVKGIDRRRRGIASLPTSWVRVFSPTALVFCALGAAGEYLAIVCYTELAKRTEDRVVESFLRSIIRQEGQHLAFFLAAARVRGEVMSPLNALVARRVLARLWEPIGLASLGQEAWRTLCGGWLDDRRVVERIRMMDPVMDTIPRLEGLNLMATFLSTWDRQ